MYFSDIFTNVASTSFAISPQAVQHFSDIYQNWPVNACLTPSHNYPTHTSYLVIITALYIVSSEPRDKESPLWFISEMLYLRRRVANYYNLFKFQIPRSTFIFTILSVAFTVLGTSEDRCERHLSFFESSKESS
jgi:hypothetical protein